MVVDSAVGDGLGQMGSLNVPVVIQIGDGAGHPQDPAIGAGG